MKTEINRRKFLKTTTTAGAGAAALRYATVAGMLGLGGVPNIMSADTDKPVALGGKPIRTTPFPSWPIYEANDEKGLLEVLHSRKWSRSQGEAVNNFEAAYAQLTGAKHCIGTCNGTSGLIASLGVLGVGPGDEVIIPPYTFLATVNAVLMQHALPVFVDTDPETSQIDASKIEAAITDRTVAIMPVHLGGGVANLDVIMDISRRRKIPVIEDACQGVLAEWRGKKIGTYGATGVFSCQQSKNMTSGEGGLVVTNDDDLAYKIFCFINNCRARKTETYKLSFNGHHDALPTPDERRLFIFSSYHGNRGANMRMPEFQAGLLMTQMTRIQEQAKTRSANAQYLTKQLLEIPGILPAKDYEGCTRHGHHLYMFRYKKEQFAGLPRVKFLKALDAEGIPTMAGYSPLNTESYISDALKARGYQRSYPAEVLANWSERTRCPANDQLCDESVWLAQEQLLGPQQDMEDIAAAIRKIRSFAVELANV